MPADPVRMFHRWYALACRAGVPLRDACALATADQQGRPAVRYVLLKDADRQGFTFYTNLRSRKGRELRDNPRAALAFYWHKVGRQIRMEGRVRPVPAAEADAYWATRPRESQLGAWASEQSRPVKSRPALLRQLAAVRRRFAGRPVLRPSHWTGFRLVPAAIEFWTRGAFRLHDRLLYTRRPRGWRVTRLQP